MKTIILILTAIATSLMAGLFYAWSYSVTLGLARLSDIGYISAMQALNRAILNPLFFICFFGAAILLPFSTYLYYTPAMQTQFWLLLAAVACYIIGVMGVTIFGNVPLNESLDTFNVSSASIQEISAKRIQFEDPWNNLNNIRTLSSVLAMILVIIACIVQKEG